MLATTRVADWRAWLIGTAVFAVSTALVVLIASLLLGITITVTELVLIVVPVVIAVAILVIAYRPTAARSRN